MAPDRLNQLEALRSLDGVVVGDDGSSHALVAVQAAVLEAERRDATLHVVRAWSLATAVRPAEVPFGSVPSMDELEVATREAELDRLRGLIGAEAKATVHVVHAPPAEALLAASENAELLVVGHRGLGGFDRLVLGSVAEQCVRHATCSVLVSRAP